MKKMLWSTRTGQEGKSYDERYHVTGRAQTT
jgi:hypothetical protein